RWSAERGRWGGKKHFFALHPPRSTLPDLVYTTKRRRKRVWSEFRFGGTTVPELAVRKRAGRRRGPMQCPSCNAANSADARQCSACGTRLRRRRNSGVASEAAVNPWIHSSNRMALTAYRCSLLAMIPFLGLGLGPLAIVLGLLGRRSE